MSNCLDEFFQYLPQYRDCFTKIPDSVKNRITDLYLSAGFSPVFFLGRERFCPVAPIFSPEEMQDLIFALCDFSVYKHVEELKKGFISAKGNFRVGICGTAVTEGERIDNIKEITSLTIRIPRLIHGAADDLLCKAKSLHKGILLVGEPSSGKTTLLRDLIHLLSERRLVVLDERWELTGGERQKNIQVLYGYPKKSAISHAVRNLGAEIILCDELEENDLPAVKSAVHSGASLIATVHGNTVYRPLVQALAETGGFSQIAELTGRDSPCKVRRVWEEEELLEAYRCRNHRDHRSPYRLSKGFQNGAKTGKA